MTVIQRRRARRCGVGFSLLLSLGTTAACQPGDRPEFLALATAGTGGVYYLVGGSIAEIWSRELPDYLAVAEVTGGSVENLSLLPSGPHVATPAELLQSASFGASADEKSTAGSTRVWSRGAPMGSVKALFAPLWAMPG